MAWNRTPLDPKWVLLMAAWRARQMELASRVIEVPLRPLPRFVAGADAALSPDREWVLAAVVVWDRMTREVIESVHGAARAEYPYIPGYLGFRESPALEKAFRKLTVPFGAVLFDGMGKAHPRRCGIAVQMALTLDVPGIGVGKTRLYGVHQEPGPEAGSAAPLMDRDECIGMVLRTKNKVKPLYISVGHRADLETAVALVRACDGGYRLPEPTRLADQEAARFKKEWVAPARRVDEAP